MALSEKTKRAFIRLNIERELSDDEVQLFFDCVDDIAGVDNDAIAYDEDGNELDDLAVVEYEEDGIYMYEIPVNEFVFDDEGNKIAIELAKLIDDDFEIESKEI